MGQKGVKGLIVIPTASKRWTGGRGPGTGSAQIALGHGMRVVGPNWMGVLNTDPAIRIYATFSPADITRQCLIPLSERRHG